MKLIQLMVWCGLILAGVCIVIGNGQRIERLEKQVTDLEQRAHGIAAQIVYENLLKDGQGELVDPKGTTEAYLRTFYEQYKGPFEAKFPGK